MSRIFSFLLFFVGLCAGVGLGWWLRDGQVPAVQVSATEGQASEGVFLREPRLTGSAVTDRAGSGEESQNTDFETGLSQIRDLVARQDFGQAMAQLFTVAETASTFEQRSRLEVMLADVSDQYARVLAEQGQPQLLDRHYEEITLRLPELPEYYMKLAELRIRMGNRDAALAPLAQIQNHPALGEKARKLLAEAEASGRQQDELLADIPLDTYGGQYIISARIDGQFPVSLMIDTGAAVTIIDPGVLRRLGYDLGREKAWFSTANGAVAAPVVELGHLAVGGAGIDDVWVGALAIKAGGGIDGLLGMNFLRRYQFRIDQDQQRLHLEYQR
ncbi:MAG: retroviral-like aspartic protease family protein [Pseudomonadales bacterium]|nr:retroviral-like aspartic protease family protein [Pseudomonadales bacterium]